MATISEAEILKAAAEASLMSAGSLDNFAAVTQVLAGTSSSVGDIGQTMGRHMNVPTNDSYMAGPSQGLEDAEYANVPTVSENAVIRSGFEVGGKTYDNVTALLAAHLVGVEEVGTSMKGEMGTSTDFDESFSQVGEAVTYKILRGGTKRGNDKLVDSLGFSYTMKNTKSKSPVTYWWCTVRNKNCKCPAIVKQIGDTFSRGKWKHEHLVGLNKSTNFSPIKVKKKEIMEKKKLQRKLKEENRVPDYIVIKEGSKAGMDLLKDKFGYTYTMRKANKLSDKCSWICSIRNKHLRCPASVYQTDNNFRPSDVPHKHLPGEKTEKPPEVVAAYNEAFIKNVRGNEANESEEDEYYEDDDDDEFEYDNNDDGYDYGDTASGTLIRSSKHKKQGKKEHPTFLGPTCTINLTKCESPGCNCKLVHCPFCDRDHFKPAKPARVQDHLEMSHFAHGVQFDEYMIVKCFKDCGQKKFGHYHCVFCKEQIIKRNAYGRHLSRHMRKKGIPTNLLILPDSKFPDTINAYGSEIPICKKDCKMSEGKHFHCPKCDRVCRERSVTVNHVWRCLQAEKLPPEDDPIDIDDAEDYELEESLLKEHFSIVKNFKDLNMERCEDPHCCRNMYHCQLCPPKLYRPTYKQQLIVHYISHWKTRVPYKNFNILRCFHACLDPRLPPIKSRYHYHCPLCSKILRQRNTFQDHLSYCHYFNTGESVTIEGVNDHTQDIAKISEELTPLMDSVDYMEDMLTMEAKLNQALKSEASVSPRRASRTRQSSTAVKQDSEDEADKSMGEDNEEDDAENSGDEGRVTPTPAVHEEFLKHLTSKKSNVAFEDITKELGATSEEKRIFKKKHKTQDLDVSMIFETASAILSETLVNSFKKESSLKACLSIVTERTDTKVIHSEAGGKKTYMLTGNLEDLNVAQQLFAQLILPTEKAHAFSKHSQSMKDRAIKIKKEIQGSDDDQDKPMEIDERSSTRKKAESYKEKMARIKRAKAAEKKKTEAQKRKAQTQKQAQEKKKIKSKGQQDASENEDISDSFPYSEIKEIIAASKKVDQKGKTGKTTKKGKERQEELVVRYSSRGRALTPKQDTPRKSTANSPAGKTPKVVLKDKKSNIKSSSTPGRYSTRGARVDYQKMNSGQVVIKQEVFSDEEMAIFKTVDSDEFEIENSENEGEHEEKIKRKRGRPPKGTKTKRATVMYKPITDSEISEPENSRPMTDSDNEQDESLDDSKIASETLSDDADDYISDLEEEGSKANDEVDNENKRKSDSTTEMEDKGTLEDNEVDSDEKQSDNEPKVTVQLISRGSPVKIGSAASNVEKTLDATSKQVIPLSQKKVISENSKNLGKDKQWSSNKGVKIVASVPMINNKDARKVCIRSRKRPAKGTSENDIVKRPKNNDANVEMLEINENIDKEDEQKLSAMTGIHAIPAILAKDNLKCSLCDFEAEIFPVLTEHLIHQHNIIDPPRCDICEIDFASVQQVQAHLDKEHGPQQEIKKYKCGACESIFTTRKLCESHITRVHLQNEKESGQSRKGVKYSCEKCEFFSTSAQEFYDHMKLKHDIDIVCDLCSKTFSNIANLKLHKESVHFKNKMAACEICDKQFNHIRYLKAHMESHRQVGRFECAQCHRRFTTKVSLVAHIETHKAPEERVYKYVCNYCGKKYMFKSNYDDHLNKHTGAKPHSCKICNKSFGFRSMLIKHRIYVHTQERPFSCGQCHKAFKFRRLLQNHMTTHTLQSKHVCSKCSKHFTTKSSLKVHEQKCMGITKQVPPVSKTSTLILHIDGKPTLYHLGVGNEQVISTGAGNMVDTIISIPEQPVVQEQILTNILTDHEQTTPVFTQQMTPVLPQQTFMAPPMITEPSPASGGLLTGPQSTFGHVEMAPEKTELAAPEQTRDAEVYVCSECDAMFGSFDDAQTHILTVHSEQAIS